ncbi:MAG: DUF5686 and carboxypeptidase regulatory-like domain-containing protein [Tannerellaceae bacterium]|nr:DUF5686 and carboxypeptidase regulatory-like domain-containing protein [Tannerellaceae bacterium]
MRIILLTICLHLFAFNLYAARIKGKVQDENSSPISYATLYIRELALGIVLDEKGEFQTTLNPGKYTFEFSALGYERKSIRIEADQTDQELDIRLESKVYSLQEVQISTKGEDPAYGIMRKAISMAPYYLNQVKRYKSDAYIKGTVKVDKIPKYAKVLAREEDLGQYENKLFLLESHNQITFTAPATYTQHVVAFSSSIPADIDSDDALELMTTSVYDPNAFGRISPLAPGAFTYYKFALDGVTTDGDHLVNKIRVTPKKKNPKLVTGWIYIIENSWNVKSIDLFATEMGITLRVTATYNEVKPLAYLPTSYDIDMKINLVGVKATGKYYSSIRYKEVELNEDQRPVSAQLSAQGTPPVKKEPEEKPKTKQQEKAEVQLEKLLEKENLSTRDAYKAARLMEKLTEPEEITQRKESLEILESGSRVQVTTDSLAAYRDSMYWESIRNLPLRAEEIVSYQIKDSLKQAIESGNSSKSIEIGYKSTGKFGLGDVLMGRSFKTKKGYRFEYGGLLRGVPEYNFTDGFWLGQKFAVGKSFERKRSLEISPSVYYLTARKEVNWQIEGTYKYSPLKNGILQVSGGKTTADFNGEDGETRWLNSLASLFFATNPIRFYEKEFIEACHRIDLANGLFFTTGLAFENRKELVNHTSYSFFGGNPSPNIPEGYTYTPMYDHHATRVSLGLEYTPRYKYRIWGGRKHYESSSYPTFSLFYEKGIAGGNVRNSAFNRLEMGIKQELKLTEFDHLQYFVNAGTIFDATHIGFPDYKHFTTSGLVITDKPVYTAFHLLDPYRFSTAGQWVQVHASYTSQYLFLKRIPFLQRMIFDEGLHVKTLFIPGRNYSEAGYTIGFRNVIRAGVFTGFEKGKYDSFGVKISLPVLLEF